MAAALAALLQWAVPHGWMVGTARQGSALLVPCPGVSPALAAVAERAPAFVLTHDSGAGHGAHHGHHMAHPFAPGTAAEPADQPPDHSGHGEDASFASALCDFAALGAPVLPPSPPVLEILAPVPVAPLALIRFAIAPGRGLAAPPPPATGPPPIIA
ncbi:MAG: hypothetical protein HLUCCX21_06240 [Porphyrobacter sp. HL-46]|nr:MAG: hypothetical protein HLUCCX21_06240 [Porphyrobacter sp. HL-46]